MKCRGHCAVLLATSALFAAFCLLFAFESDAAESEPSQEEARVTVVFHDVKLLPEDQKPRPAELNETVKEDIAVRTGHDSRSELTFVDLTITRLGSNTVFSFNKAGRNVQLNAGSMLLRVPKNSGGAQLKTDACSIAITGTTLILDAMRSGRNKLTVLEGSARMSLNNYPNESALAHGGQLLDVPPGAKKMPAPVHFDVRRMMKSHVLITKFPRLPSENEIYAGTNSSGARSTPQNPAVYNPPPLPPPGNYPGGGAKPVGPNYPGGKGKSPGGTNTPNGPSNPGKGSGGKGKKNPDAPNNTGKGGDVGAAGNADGTGAVKPPRGKKPIGKTPPKKLQPSPSASPSLR